MGNVFTSYYVVSLPINHWLLRSFTFNQPGQQSIQYCQNPKIGAYQHPSAHRPPDYVTARKKSHKSSRQTRSSNTRSAVRSYLPAKYCENCTHTLRVFVKPNRLPLENAPEKDRNENTPNSKSGNQTLDKSGVNKRRLGCHRHQPSISACRSSQRTSRNVIQCCQNEAKNNTPAPTGCYYIIANALCTRTVLLARRMVEEICIISLVIQFSAPKCALLFGTFFVLRLRLSVFHVTFTLEDG